MTANHELFRQHHPKGAMANIAGVALSSIFPAFIIMLMFIFSAFETLPERKSTIAPITRQVDGTLKGVTNVDSTGISTPPYNFINLVKTYSLARPFQPHYATPYSWCTHEYNSEKPTGLLYVKTPKAASSTTSGVALRIAHRSASRNVPKQIQKLKPCDAHVEHIPDYKVGKKYGHRDVEKSFLFTSIRDPAKRAVSRIFFGDVSKDGHEPTDENMLRWLQNTDSQKGSVSPGMGGFQLAYLSLDPVEPGLAWSNDKPTAVKNSKRVHEYVRQVIQDYDFMIVVERYDESLVAMQLQLGLDVGDILYLTSKHAGDYWYQRGKRKCVSLRPTFVSPVVAKHLSSEEWYTKNYGDYLLYEAANQSLDLTIDHIGRSRFEDALRKFQELKNHADVTCASKAIFPCDVDGHAQTKKARSSCYRKDWGCGYPCLDELLEDRL